MEKFSSLSIIFPDKSKLIINDIPEDIVLRDIKYSILENEKIQNLNKDFYFAKDGKRIDLADKVKFDEIEVFPVPNVKTNWFYIYFLFFMINDTYSSLQYEEFIIFLSVIMIIMMKLFSRVVKYPLPPDNKNGFSGFVSLIIRSFNPEFKLEEILIDE